VNLDEAREHVTSVKIIGGDWVGLCNWDASDLTSENPTGCAYRSKIKDSREKAEHQASEHVRDKHG
jgi:hypothetical protein